ncbi:MAG: hypothetical protein ACREMF_11920 [Gemmatimonadales bacterium]
MTTPRKTKRRRRPSVAPPAPATREERERQLGDWMAKLIAQENARLDREAQRDWAAAHAPGDTGRVTFDQHATDALRDALGN